MLVNEQGIVNQQTKSSILTLIKDSSQNSSCKLVKSHCPSWFPVELKKIVTKNKKAHKTFKPSINRVDYCNKRLDARTLGRTTS